MLYLSLPAAVATLVPDEEDQVRQLKDVRYVFHDPGLVAKTL